MSWLVYLLGCAIVSALAAGAIVLVLRLSAPAGLDRRRFSEAAERLAELDDRGGYTWARLGPTPLRVRARPARAPTHLSLDLLGEGASVTIVASTRRGAAERLAALPGDAELDARFGAWFEHERGLEWPSPAAKAAVMAWLAREPTIRSVELRASPRGIGLDVHARLLTDELVVAALDLLAELRRVPERLRGFDPPARPAGGPTSIIVGLAWALIVSVAASYTARFAERTEATVVGRDDSWLGNETSLVIRDPDGRERGLVWVPVDVYEGCQPGQTLRRERFAVEVACDDQTSSHLAFLAQLPFLLLCWLGMAVGVIGLLDWRDEARHRAAGG